MGLKKALALALTLVSLNVAGQQVSAKRIYEELNKQEVMFPYIALQIATLETGRGKTARHNNIFGFRTPKGYMKFKSWESAVARYKQWQDKYYPKHLSTKHKGGSKCNYYCFLLSIGYNSGRERSQQEYRYISKLKTMTIRGLM